MPHCCLPTDTVWLLALASLVCAEAYYVTQAGLNLMILLPLTPKCRKYRNVQPLLSLFSYFNSHLIHSLLLLLSILCPSTLMMCV